MSGRTRIPDAGALDRDVLGGEVMTSSNWSPISAGSVSKAPDSLPPTTACRGASQLGAVLAAWTPGHRSVRAGSPLVGLAAPTIRRTRSSPVAEGSRSDGAECGAAAMSSATACLQLISTGQLQAPSIATMRSDGDRVTLIETAYGNRFPPWTSPNRHVLSFVH